MRKNCLIAYQSPSFTEAVTIFRIDKRNAVSVYLFTSLMGPWDLHLTAQEFILQHFEQVAVKSKDFCALSRDQISRLISSEKLLVSSEGEVYKAVVSWVAHDPKNRATLLPALLQHVHFPLMSMDEVEQSSRSHLVKKNKNLATALEEARTYLAKVIRPTVALTSLKWLTVAMPLLENSKRQERERQE